MFDKTKEKLIAGKNWVVDKTTKTWNFIKVNTKKVLISTGIVGVAMASPLYFGVDVNLSTEVKFISLSQLSELQSKGYTKSNSVNDVAETISEFRNQKNAKHVNGKVWWIELKDRAENKDILFSNLLYKELNSYYENENFD